MVGVVDFFFNRFGGFGGNKNKAGRWMLTVKVCESTWGIGDFVEVSFFFLNLAVF